MRLNSLTDYELWILIVSGDYRAFTMLYERHWSKLYKTAQKYIKDKEACEEMIHDLFVSIWIRREHLKILDFSQYFKVATRYQVYTYLKKHKASQLIYCDDIPEETGCYELNSGQERILYSELEQQLASHLQSLPERCHEIFLLSRKDHLSNLEISERLGISKRTVENQITIALKHLRLCLKDLVVMMILVDFSMQF